MKSGLLSSRRKYGRVDTALTVIRRGGNNEMMQCTCTGTIWLSCDSSQLSHTEMGEVAKASLLTLAPPLHNILVRIARSFSLLRSSEKPGAVAAVLFDSTQISPSGLLPSSGAHAPARLIRFRCAKQCQRFEPGVVGEKTSCLLVRSMSCPVRPPPSPKAGG